jgi:uncharacterized membrane protein YeaQ/YmgE (transglycosylase-associated protein family)
MSGQELLIILLVGLIAGWLAGQIVQGTGFGLIADIAIGIVGAFIGAWLLPHLHIHLGSSLVAAIVLGCLQSSRYVEGGCMGIAQIMRKPWSVEEVLQLRKLVRQNTPAHVIARKLGRSKNAVYVKASR